MLRDLETKGAIEEVALKELEIETQKGFLQQELARLIEMFVILLEYICENSTVGKICVSEKFQIFEIKSK